MTIQNLGNFGGPSWGWPKENLLDLSDMHSSPGSHPPDRGPAQLSNIANKCEEEGAEPPDQICADELGTAAVAKTTIPKS